MLESFITNYQSLQTLSFDVQVLHYEGYGASYIKKHKASPDAWAQLVKQLAFYKLFGRPPVVYESAQTRKFQNGRTEVIRSTSNEALEFVKAMENPKETVRGVTSFMSFYHGKVELTKIN